MEQQRTTEGVRQLPVRLPADEYRALKAAAFFTGKSMNTIVLEALRAHLDGAGGSEHFLAMLDKVETEYRPALDKLADL